MKIELNTLNLLNFKNHHELLITFGNYTELSGSNGEGKTTIGEAVTWTLFGTDMLGNERNYDPTPTNYEFDKVRVDLLMSFDGKPVMFTREIVKGKQAFYINDIPKKANEYKDTVQSLVNSADLFLSLFSPHYFPTMAWTDQRKMLLGYVIEPAQKEVLAKLPKLQADKLKVELKKHTIDEIEAKHRKLKTDTERDVIAQESSVKTLERFNSAIPAEKSLDVLQAECDALRARVKEADEIYIAYSSFKARHAHTEMGLKPLLEKAEETKQQHEKAKVATNCKVCAQPISDETRARILDGLKETYKERARRYKDAKAAFDAMEAPPKPDDGENSVHSLQDQLTVAVTAYQTEVQRLKAAEAVEDARTKLEEAKATLSASIFLLDAVKAYKAAEAELQAEKVQSLFQVLTVILYTTNKGDGEKKPTFELEMNGKPYRKLSQGEKAQAGLELIKVLREQSGIECTVFFDGAESFTGDLNVKGQLIAAYAKPDTKLKMAVFN